jgi:hypothetical protein
VGPRRATRRRRARKEASTERVHTAAQQAGTGVEYVAVLMTLYGAVFYLRWANQCMLVLMC